MKNFFGKIINFIKINKKASIITAIVVAVLVVALILILTLGGKKTNDKNSDVPSGPSIEEIGEWWSSGDSFLIQEGEIPVTE